MPAFPRFLRFHRPHSCLPRLSPEPRDGSPYLALGTSEQDSVNAPTGVSGPPTPGNPNHHQNSTERLFVAQGSAEASDQPGLVPLPITATSVAESNSIRLLSSVAQQPGITDYHEPLVPLHPVQSLTTPQQSSSSQWLDQYLRQYSSQPQHQNPAMFNQAHDFTVTGTFIENNITHNNASPSQFMKALLKETIPGAWSDALARTREPVPRCHPGTRLAVLRRSLDFIPNCSGVKKVRFVVGAAGVGKSAIMQSIAESPPSVAHCASIFFCANGRCDGTKVFTTLCYQFAAKSDPYRVHIQHEIDRDPSLLQSSMEVQFRKFIAEPFIHNPPLNSAGRILIIIDGLDECDKPQTQQELLRLISDFCVKYPSSPIVWLITSRPEPHINSFLSRGNVMPTYEKEVIQVDSDESRADVERFLRDELKEIKRALGPPDRQWPEEQDFRKLANASGGLFAYAHTAIRYIGDLAIGNPASQLSDVLKVIDNYPMINLSREEHPMALLDALYTKILSNVHSNSKVHTRKLLLALASDWDWALSLGDDKRNFVVLCNWLGMSCDDAYAAVNLLQSVLYVPQHAQACREGLKPFHKSFIDFVSDSARSGYFSDIKHEADELKTQCAYRILQEAPNDIDFGDVSYPIRFGTLTRARGTCDKISLAWSVGEGAGWNDKQTRLAVYELAVGEDLMAENRGDPIFQSEYFTRLCIQSIQFISCVAWCLMDLDIVNP